MPSLKTLGRRWLVGGDELQVVSLILIPLRVLQGFVLFFGTDSLMCSGFYDGDGLLSSTFYAYTTITFILLLTSILIESLLLIHSSKGTPTSPETRLPSVPLLVTIKALFLGSVNFILVVLGFIVLVYYRVSCGEGFFARVGLVVLYISHVAEFVIMTTCMYALRGRRLSDPNLGNSGLRSRYGTDHVESKYARQCKFLCNCSAAFTCFLFGGSDNNSGDFGMIASILADYFEDDGALDIVPSDVMAGIIMLRHAQKSREYNNRMTMTQSQSHSANSSPSSSHALDSLLPSPSSPSAFSFESSTRTSTSTRTQNYSHRVSNRQVLYPSNPEDRVIMEEVARFSRHALAMYTWMLYVYMHPATGFCKLCAVRCCRMKGKGSCFGLFGGGGEGEGCCLCPGKGKAQRSSSNESTSLNQSSTNPATNIYGNSTSSSNPVIGDCCNGIHTAGLLAQANLDSSELAYAHFGNTILENPYCIIVDHKWKTVCLAIRGTLSLEDCIKDALCVPAPLDEMGRKWGFDGEGEYGHAGMVKSSEWIREDLNTHCTLDKLLLGDNAKYPTYRLRVVGHSLGAGCALFLSLMLKTTYPNLRCLPFSPPGGLISIKLARAVTEFTVSSVLNTDVVPRLSIDSMEQLRNETLELIARIKVNKMEVLKSAVGNDEREEAFMKQLLHDVDDIPENEFFKQLKKFKSVQANIKASRSGNSISDVILYPPGKIIHFIKTDETPNCCIPGLLCRLCFGKKRTYTPYYADNDEFNDIVISPSMMLDHFPDRVCESVEGVAKGWGIDVTGGSILNDNYEGGVDGWVGDEEVGFLRV